MLEDLDERFLLQVAPVHGHAAHGLRFQNPLLLLPSAPATSPAPAPSLGSGSLLRCVPLSERQVDAVGQFLDVVCQLFALARPVLRDRDVQVGEGAVEVQQRLAA